MWVDPVGQPEPAWPPPTGPPRYDYELITALEALIAKGETGWRQLYNELGLTPHQVVYEELSSPALTRGHPVPFPSGRARARCRCRQDVLLIPGRGKPFSRRGIYASRNTMSLFSIMRTDFAEWCGFAREMS